MSDHYEFRPIPPGETSEYQKWLTQHEEMLAHAPHLDTDIAIPGLMPGRYVRITWLTIVAAYDVVRLEYEVVPIDSAPTRENAKESRALGPHWWYLSGRDSVGTEYQDGGGAYGLPDKGVIADGDHDLRPAPPADATWLEIGFQASGEPDTFEAARYVFRVALPLRVAESG